MSVMTAIHKTAVAVTRWFTELYAAWDRYRHPLDIRLGNYVFAVAHIEPGYRNTIWLDDWSTRRTGAEHQVASVLAHEDLHLALHRLGERKASFCLDNRNGWIDMVFPSGPGNGTRVLAVGSDGLDLWYRTALPPALLVRLHYVMGHWLFTRP